MAITWPTPPFTDGQEHPVAGVGVYKWNDTLGVWSLVSRESTVLTESDVLDEDDFASLSATKPPSQQSVEAWVFFNAIMEGQYADALLPVPPFVTDAAALTLQDSLGYRIVACTSTTDPVIVTVPDHATWDHPDGFWSILFAAGDESVTVAFAGGVDPIPSTALLTIQPGQFLLLSKESPTEWLVGGGTS